MIELPSPFVELSEIVFKSKHIRKGFIYISILSLTIGVCIPIYYKANNVPSIEYFKNTFPYFLVPSGVTFFLWAIHLLSKIKGPLELQLEKLHIERSVITRKIENKSAKESQIFNTIQLSLNQLTEYYSINKAQARSSFGFSIFAIVLGLLTIISGIWMFYLQANPNINLTILTGIAGVLLEFIGGAYFFMYKKSLEQVNFFFGQLIKIQDTMLSIDLSKNIGSKEKEVEMTEKIILSLLERSLK